MIKVFIVEDEPLILRTIKQMIEQTHNSFKVVGEALDGQKALEGIENLKPDVVFTDIKMPIMDGLTLVSRLHEQKSNIITVVLSGYQEFEYARKALQLGVSDYLLKPLSPTSLKSLLNKIYDDIHTKICEQQLETLKKIIFNSLSTLEMESEKLMQLFDFNEYHYMLLCSGSFCTFSCSWITPAKDFWIKNNLQDHIGRHMNGKNSYWILDGEHGNEKIVILGISDNSNVEARNIIIGIHNELNSFDFPITSVAGAIGNDISRVGTLIQRSRITLNKSIRFAKSSLVFDEAKFETQQDEDLNMPDANTEKTLNILIKNFQVERLKQELHKLLDLCEKKSFKQLTLERLIKHLLNLFYISLGSISDSRTVEIDMEINELLSNSTSYRSLYEGITFIIDDLFRTQKLKIESDDSQKALVDKIEQYIKSNFCNQISLQNLSDNFGMVPPYLSRVYKKVKGISPNDYIERLRIEKAKELLMIEPPLVLKDIAETVGFNDRFYLSKVFKSVTGKTPSEFRAEKYQA